MITFEGRQQSIKTAGMLCQRAHNTYPHISSSLLRKRMMKQLSRNKNNENIDVDYCKKVSDSIKDMRERLKQEPAYYSALVYEMQDKKIGNCFEDAMLAQLIGKINGQEIYTSEEFFLKKNMTQKNLILIIL